LEDSILLHDELMEDVNSCRMSVDELAVWWLGQHSFIVKTGGKVIYLDPFLTAHPARMLPSLLEARDVINADVVLGSHDHADHIDYRALDGIAKASPDAVFLFPELLRQTLSGRLAIDGDRVIGMDDGVTVDVKGLSITGIASAHEFLDRDATSGRHPYLGYVVEGNGKALYHSGDTCIYEGLLGKLKRWTFDLVFLPINGRDAERLRTGCIGNMTYQEAADLSGSLKPGVTIPGHYGMFENNTIDPMLFVDYMSVKYPHLKVHPCRPGERFVVD